MSVVRCFVIAFAIVSILTGCGVARVSCCFESGGRKYSAVQLADLKSKTSENVVRYLGMPNDSLTNGNMNFMLYANKSYSPRAYGRGAEIHCLKIDLNQNNIVQDFKIKRMLTYKYRFDKSPEQSALYFCKKSFWSEDELKELEAIEALQLANFKSKTSENVVRYLGMPNDSLTNGNMNFMLYANKSYSHSVDRSGSKTHCLKIDLDQNNIVQDFQTREMHAYRSRSDKSPEQSALDFCKKSFWSEDELKELEAIGALDIDDMKRMIESGNIFLIFNLYKKLIDQDPRSAIRWLCRAAENGDTEAMFRVGRIFEFGKDDMDKPTKRVAKIDYVQAYVWYSLSAEKSGWYDKRSLNAFVKRRLDKKTLEDAKKELKERKPGQCDKKIVLIQDIQ